MVIAEGCPKGCGWSREFEIDTSGIPDERANKLLAVQLARFNVATAVLGHVMAHNLDGLAEKLAVIGQKIGHH